MFLCYIGFNCTSTIIGYFQLPPELQNVQTVLHRSEQYLRTDVPQYVQHKRNSRASDTSSAYSGLRHGLNLDLDMFTPFTNVYDVKMKVN